MFLVGTFSGSFIAGFLADCYGRRFFFLLFSFLLIPFCLLPILSDSEQMLIVCQFLIGFLIGADTPVSQSMATELSLPSQREKALSTLMLSWFVGAIFTIPTIHLLDRLALGNLYCYAVAAVIVSISFLGRIDIPESAVWLAGKKKVNHDPIIHYRCFISKEFIFCCGFWITQTIPVTVVMFYFPSLMEAITSCHSQSTKVLLLYTFFLLGILPFTFFKNKFPLNKILTLTFFGMAIGLAGVANFHDHPTAIFVNLSFILYAFCYGMQSVLDFVYPNLLFPTTVRTSVTGSLLTITRVVGALVALIFPYLMKSVGNVNLIWSGSVLCLAGCFWPFFLRYHQTEQSLHDIDKPLTKRLNLD